MVDSEAAQFEKAVFMRLNKTSADPLTRALANAATNKQKSYVMKAAFGQFKSKKDFAQFLDKAVNNKLISDDFADGAFEDFKSKEEERTT
jgi:hypothetical protein